MRWHSISVLVLILPSLALAQVAGEFCNVDRWGSETRGREWNQMFRETYDELRANAPGTTARSAKRARKLLDRLIDGFVSGPSGSRFLGFTTYLLAVAEQRLGKSDDAAWHWQMAQNFAPELQAAYTDFGDVAPFLQRNLLVEKAAGGETGAGSTVGPPDRPSPNESEETRYAVRPPQIVRKVLPSYPLGAQQSHLAGAAIVRAYIDRAGIPRAPTVEHGCGVTVLDVAALDAVRQWRYKPATLDGSPVSVWLTVTVSFEMHR